MGSKTAALVSQVHKIRITIVESELESLLLEAFYIKKFDPKYNIRLTDNKSYPLIRITYNDAYPAILVARRIEDPKSLYFGPYPEGGGAVKLVLRTIRRIFPFQSTMNHPKKRCLYHHLGLCPCLPVTNSPEEKRAYKANLRSIIRILEGESPQLLKELEKERDAASNEERFEDAAVLQKKIHAMEFITKPFHLPFAYDVNPNLRSDVREEESKELLIILQKAGYALTSLHKIECYDISHIQGTNTTASLVVFVAGEKASGMYRRFKVRLEKTPDDFASMREVLQRRLKHTEWEMPDLVIVDGGKGQVSAALAVFNELGITIPLIGLAKREETIVIPLNHPLITRHSEPSSEGLRRSEESISEENRKDSSPLAQNDKTGSFKEIVLPKNSKALHLIQRIRDEAHRFAITYHRNLRSKTAISG